MKKILVVDDLEDVRKLVGATLVREKYQIITAKDGPLAIETAKVQKPDLIIMDISMPGSINGLEATRILKSDPETSRCPIIILSGKNLAQDCFEAGADSCFLKPFSPLQLIKKVEELLSTTPPA
jgi:two-component system, OmpR family, phosphate regulon response regulator PhoB